MIIAIDGPAASGKSTTAKLVAKKLKFSHLDTGGMYRCIALSFLRNDISFVDNSSSRKLVEDTKLELDNKNGRQLFILNGEDVTIEIRNENVTNSVSIVSSLSFIRKHLVGLQRDFARKNDSVIEGRDIGTVVFPNADFKFFLIADDKVRAERRQLDLIKYGENRPIHQIIEEIRKRDRFDSERKDSPLLKAENAVEIDTSYLSINEQVDFIIKIVKSEMKG